MAYREQVFGIEKSNVVKAKGTFRESKWCAVARAQWVYHSKLMTQDIAL